MDSDNKTLYLCFNEYKLDSSFAYIIQAIKLSDLLSPVTNTNSLSQVAYTSSDDNFPAFMTCSAFGSKIMFVGGQKSSYDPIGFGPTTCRDIYVFETDPKFGTSKLKLGQDKLRAFPHPKKKPILVEQHGKLYALSRAPVDRSLGFSFEVFDQRKGNWSSLPEPPSTLRAPAYDEFDESLNRFNFSAENHFAPLIVGNNLFLFRQRDMLSYNMANPSNNTWKKHRRGGHDDYPCTRHNRTASVGIDGGDGDFVVFYHDGLPIDRTLIQVYLMSQDSYYSLKRIKPDLELNMDNEMLPPPQFRQRWRGGQPRFVHLGGRRVCMVSSSFMGPLSRSCPADDEKISFFVVVFEFRVVNREFLDVQFLTKRLFEYKYQEVSRTCS